MIWILYIIGGIFLLGILNEMGVFVQFFAFLLIVLVCGGIGYLIFSDTGATVGVIIGSLLYLLMCIGKIVHPDEKTVIEGYSDGSIIKKRLSDRGEGIAGIVMLVLLGLLCYFL